MGGQFSQYTQFDQGKCTLGNCDGILKKYGYAPGCQLTPNATYGGWSSAWYSLPGRCPMLQWNDPNKTNCMKHKPGGECKHPDGDAHCTWKVEDAGSIILDELVGIADHDAFCKAGNYEYDDATDKGRGCSFFDNRWDNTANEGRMLQMLQLFRKKHPNMTSNLDLPDPVCDGF